MHADVSADVNVFHFIALARSNEIDDVEVLEVSTHVVFEIDAMIRVAACRSPVGGVTLKGFHSCQTQAVQIPVLGVLVHWRVKLERDVIERDKPAILSTPGHHQGPGRTRLRLKVTESWVRISTIVVKFENAALRGAPQKVIKTRSRTKYISPLFCFRTSVSLRNNKTVVFYSLEISALFIIKEKTEQ